MVKTGGNAMKKIISFFAMAAMLLVSCTNELDDNNSVAGVNPSEEGIFAPGKYTFNVTVADTKAVKTAWEDGDKIFVFFDDEATKVATGVSNLPYVTLTFNGGDWVADGDMAPTEIKASGTLSAVYCPYGGGEITTENGIFYVSKSHGFYMEATEVPYTNIANEVTFALSMTMKQPYAHLVIPAEGLDKTKSYTLSVRNTDKTAGIQKTFTACINPADGSVYCKAQNVGDAVDGYWEEDGLHFYGLASLGEDKCFAFDLRDNGLNSEQILYSYTKLGIEKFEGRSNVKLPAISSWMTLTNAEHKISRLYEDGMLIINENRYEHADNALKHGDVVKEYGNITDFNMYSSSQPWATEVSSIKYAEFGTTVTPSQFRAVFSGCTNLVSIDTDNLNMANSTSLKNAFYDCQSLTTINVSNFDTANVTDLEATFYNCKSLVSLDVSSWDVRKVTKMVGTFKYCSKLTGVNLSAWSTTSALTSMKEFMRGCGKITELDLSGFNTSGVTDMGMLFYQCGTLVKIYASSAFDVSNLGSSTDDRLFYQCYKLVGGNGTNWTESNIGRAYACIDTEDTPGYFTLKQ